MLVGALVGLRLGRRRLEQSRERLTRSWTRGPAWKTDAMLRWLTAGESHGPALVAILEGLPAHVAITTDDIADALARRRLGYGRGARMKFEQDRGDDRRRGPARRDASAARSRSRSRNTEWPKWETGDVGRPGRPGRARRRWPATRR